MDRMSTERCDLLRKIAAAKREYARELRTCTRLANVSADRAGIERHAADLEADALALEAKAAMVADSERMSLSAE